ncbi:MAG: dihydrodipicolinate synthase family protein [Candidatus Bathyarchaeia archaeon]
MKRKLKGVFTFLTTPFKKEDYMELDEDGLRKNVRFLSRMGIHVLVPCGGTGEIYSLTPDECKRVVDIVAGEKGDSALVPGVPSGIKVAIEVAKHAEAAGADAVLVFPPQAASENGLYNYYKRVAGSVDIGIMPYILGGLEDVVMRNPNFIKRLTEIENVIAFKYESADLWTLGKLMNIAGENIAFICGPNFSARVSECYFRLGASGFTDGISNFAPQLPMNLYECGVNGRWDEFKEVEEKLAKLTDLRSRAGSTAFVKAALDMVGLTGGSVRPPLTPISSEYREELEKLLSELNLM